MTLIAIALLYVWVIVRSDTRRFVVREYHVSSPKIRDPLTLCVLSDLHEKDYGNGNEPLFRAIMEQQPDAVLSAGDLLTAHHRAEHCDDAAVMALVKKLCEKVSVYLGTGNHERKLSDRVSFYGDVSACYEEAVSREGAHVLHNTAPFPLRGTVDLAAVDLDRAYFSHSTQKPLSSGEVEAYCGGKPDPARFTVLIAHEPSRFPAYADWGADLVLSGHTHGGVARLFGRGVINPALQLFPFYDGGAYVRTDADDGVVRHPDGKMIYLTDGMRAMIESRGLGMHTIPVRFLNPAELVVVRLHPEQENTRTA